METVILISLLILGFILLALSLRKPPIKDWLLMFSLASYFTVILGVIAVEEHMIKYPLTIFHTHFDTSPLYELLLLPVVIVYFYQTSYNSKWSGILFQAFIYTTCLTIVEALIEKYTDLVEYLSWTWVHTFVSIFVLMLFMRTLVWLINYSDKRKM